MTDSIQVPEYQMAEFPVAHYGFIYHYYRAEVYRETNWRNRLDTTTNWSIVVTAGVLSFVFTEPEAPHTIILINYLMVWFFLYIESRRFRYYSILRHRTRLIEKQLLARIFSGKKDIKNHEQWREKLAESFTKIQVPISRLESVAWRMRRNYLAIFPLLYLAWLVKLDAYPIIASNFSEMLENAQTWLIPGPVVFTLFTFFLIFTLYIAVYIPNQSVREDMP